MITSARMMRRKLNAERIQDVCLEPPYRPSRRETLDALTIGHGDGAPITPDLGEGLQAELCSVRTPFNSPRIN